MSRREVLERELEDVLDGVPEDARPLAAALLGVLAHPADEGARPGAERRKVAPRRAHHPHERPQHAAAGLLEEAGVRDVAERGDERPRRVRVEARHLPLARRDEDVRPEVEEREGDGRRAAPDDGDAQLGEPRRDEELEDLVVRLSRERGEARRHLRERRRDDGRRALGQDVLEDVVHGHERVVRLDRIDAEREDEVVQDVEAPLRRRPGPEQPVLLRGEVVRVHVRERVLEQALLREEARDAPEEAREAEDAGPELEDAARREEEDRRARCATRDGRCAARSARQAATIVTIAPDTAVRKSSSARIIEPRCERWTAVPSVSERMRTEPAIATTAARTEAIVARRYVNGTMSSDCGARRSVPRAATRRPASWSATPARRRVVTSRRRPAPVSEAALTRA